MIPRVITVAALLTSVPVASPAQMVKSQGELKHYVVTIRRFDPAGPAGNGQTFVLPVDSPDAEHAVASTIANASAFSRKTDGHEHPAPVAFVATRIERR